jgi:hypothetical protein
MDRPSYTPESYHTCSGSHPLPDGGRVKWTCETKDGREFSRITIGSVPYDLENGRLFLLSREAGMLKVLQLETGPTQPSGSGGQELVQLEKDHPEIRDFFQK